MLVPTCVIDGHSLLALYFFSGGEYKALTFFAHMHRLIFGHASLLVVIHVGHLDLQLKLFSIRYLQRQHLVDVTEIFNLLNWEKKERLFKLGYIILLLFMCLFW